MTLANSRICTQTLVKEDDMIIAFKYRLLLTACTVVCLLVLSPAQGASPSAPPPFSTLEKQVLRSPATTHNQKIKRAVLELAVERACQAHDHGLRDEAETLAREITQALTAPPKNFAHRNPDAAHLGILKPLLSERKNPYLTAMVEAAREKFAKPDVEWIRATADKPAFASVGSSSNNPHNVRSAAKAMREYFWLFAHSQSPMRSEPEPLKRALRRAHAYIDGLALDRPDLKNRPDLYDQFAVEESFSGLYEIIELHPGLLLPSQKKAWDQALKKAADNIWKQMRNKRANNLNIETARMVGVLNMGYYTANKEMIAKVMSHVDKVLKKMHPDGGWPYHRDGNPSVNYHNELLKSLLRIYEQTKYKPITNALTASQWKGPVMGRTDEFWTSPFFKTYRWNNLKGTEAGPEAVVALSKNPYVRWLLDRDIKPDRNQVAWYRGDVKPKPLPTHYTIPDRNVAGPRAWYGEFCYAGNFGFNSTAAGHETLMGAMTVDKADGRINSVLTDVTPRIWVDPQSKEAQIGAKIPGWAKLTDRLVGATTMTRNYSVGTALHGIAQIERHAYQGKASGFQVRQIWVGLPHRIIGLVSVVPGKKAAHAHAIHGALRFVSGGTTGAKVTKELKEVGPRHYQYGQLDIRIHETTFASITPIVKTYRRPEYPAAELILSNRKAEPAPAGKDTIFTPNNDLRFLVEVSPIWTRTRVSSEILSSGEALGIQVVGKKRSIQVWLNTSAEKHSCKLQRKRLPAGKASFGISKGVLGRPTFKSQVPADVTLESGQHAVLVVSSDPYDHKPGWKSFEDMIANMVPKNDDKTNKAIDGTSQ